MEKRVLRSHARKEIEKENVIRQPQPAKRTRRAISTIECQTQYKTAAEAKRVTLAAKAMVAAAAQTAAAAARKTQFSDTSSQTDNCLISTIQQLTLELIAKGEIIQQKDQKYIEMMEKYYLERERLQAESREKTLQIVQLTQRIDNLEHVPLVLIEANGRLHLMNINCM